MSNIFISGQPWSLFSVAELERMKRHIKLYAGTAAISVEEIANKERLLWNPNFRLIHVPEKDGGWQPPLKIVIPAIDRPTRKQVREQGYFTVSHVWGPKEEWEPWTSHGIIGTDGKIVEVKIRPEKQNTLLDLLKSIPGYWWIDVFCAHSNTPPSIMGQLYRVCNRCFALVDFPSAGFSHIIAIGTLIESVELADGVVEIYTERINGKMGSEDPAWVESLEDLLAGWYEKDSADIKGLADFFNCRWFKRVWTLQEYILPRDLTFISETGPVHDQFDRMILTRIIDTLCKIAAAPLKLDSASDTVGDYRDFYFSMSSDEYKHVSSTPGLSRSYFDLTRFSTFCLYDIYHLMQKGKWIDSKTIRYGSSNLDLLTIVLTILARLPRTCMYPEDYIYGVCGLLDINIPAGLDDQEVWDSFRKIVQKRMPHVEFPEISPLSGARNMQDVYKVFIGEHLHCAWEEECSIAKNLSVEELRRMKQNIKPYDAFAVHTEPLLRNPNFRLIHVPDDYGGPRPPLKIVIPAVDRVACENVRKQGYFTVSHLWGPEEEWKPWTSHGIIGIDGNIVEVKIRPEKQNTLLDLLKSTPGYWWIDVFCAQSKAPPSIMGDAYRFCNRCFALVDFPSAGFSHIKAIGTLIESVELADSVVEIYTERINGKTGSEDPAWVESLEDLLAGWYEKDSADIKGLADFFNCRWFKRVWTLQEYILPTALTFISETGPVHDRLDRMILTRIIDTLCKIAVASLKLNSASVTVGDYRDFYFSMSSDKYKHVSSTPGLSRSYFDLTRFDAFCLHDIYHLVQKDEGIDSKTIRYGSSNLDLLTIVLTMIARLPRTCMYPEDYIYGVCGLLDMKIPAELNDEEVWGSFRENVKERIPHVEFPETSPLSGARSMQDVYKMFIGE